MSAPRIGRALLTGYPPAWRRRYGAEMRALLDESGLSFVGALSLVTGAMEAWLRPRRSWRPAPEQARGSLATVLIAWTALTAAGLIVGQLGEEQGVRSFTPGHPVSRALFQVFRASAVVSVVVLAATLSPLAFGVLRAAWRDRDRADLLRLATATLVPVLFLGSLIGVARAAGGSGNGIGAHWFIAMSGFGVASAAVSALAAASVVRRRAGEGRTLRIAVTGGAVAALAMGVASVAACADVIAVSEWGAGSSSLHAPIWVGAGYGAYVLLAGAAAIVSGARGLAAVRGA